MSHLGPGTNAPPGVDQAVHEKALKDLKARIRFVPHPGAVVCTRVAPVSVIERVFPTCTDVFYSCSALFALVTPDTQRLYRFPGKGRYVIFPVSVPQTHASGI
eukprot:3248731-Pyramimonas_sp.AAC.2